jgi:hypothetical protein
MTMKVRIQDKEALDALSWEALRAYLDRAGWQHVKDIPGKGVIYKRKGADRRLREVAVPLHRDFADYAARMGDAVGTLASAENRSELDVYEDLRALGARSESDATGDAESPRHVVSEAACAVHERIRTWMAEEGWEVRDVDDSQSSFNVMVTLQNDGPSVNIFQYKDHIDHITLSQHWRYNDVLKDQVCELSAEIQRDVTLDVFRDASIMGVEFYGSAIPLTDMIFRAYVYFDGLTKDTLIQRTLATIRALHLAILTVQRALERVDQPTDATPKIVQIVPRPEGLTTVAS